MSCVEVGVSLIWLGVLSIEREHFEGCAVLCQVLLILLIGALFQPGISSKDVSTTSLLITPL